MIWTCRFLSCRSCQIYQISSWIPNWILCSLLTRSPASRFQHEAPWVLVEDTLCRGRVLLFVKEEPCQRGLCLAMPCVLLLSLPLASLQADLSGVSGWDHLHSTSGGVVGNLRGAHMICDWIFFFGPRFCGHHPYHSVQSSREFHTYFPACNSQKFWSLCSCAWLTPVHAVLGVWDTWQTERFLKTAAGSLLLLTSFLSFYAMRMS